MSHEAKTEQESRARWPHRCGVVGCPVCGEHGVEDGAGLARGTSTRASDAMGDSPAESAALAHGGGVRILGVDLVANDEGQEGSGLPGGLLCSGDHSLLAALARLEPPVLRDGPVLSGDALRDESSRLYGLIRAALKSAVDTVNEFANLGIYTIEDERYVLTARLRLHAQELSGQEFPSVLLAMESMFIAVQALQGDLRKLSTH